MAIIAANLRPAMIRVRAGLPPRLVAGPPEWEQAAASASDRIGKAVQDLPGAGQAQRSVRAIADTVSVRLHAAKAARVQ